MVITSACHAEVPSSILGNSVKDANSKFFVKELEKLVSHWSDKPDLLVRVQHFFATMHLVMAEDTHSS